MSSLGAFITITLLVLAHIIDLVNQRRENKRLWAAMDRRDARFRELEDALKALR